MADQGAGDEGRDEATEYEDKIKKIKMSKEARDKAMAELKKQAMRQIDTDKNFRMLRASAAMASAAMTRN